MFKRLIALVAVLVSVALAGTTLQAQNRTVTGTVLDETSLPVPGVAVMQEGTSNGVVTGADGTFSIRVPEGEVVLTVSSLGYKTQKVVVTPTRSQIQVILAEDNFTLDETVVVGYGVQKKVNLTGAVATVDSKQLQDRTAHNLTNMLQGSVSGLNITTSSGAPGNSGSINIRGVTSINGADPLVLIDGAIGSLSNVNPNDVENISVIKDASAAAVYGARAAYGVILITTKSGIENEKKATVRYSGRFGWEEPTTSTDYETRGYWSVYTVDKFWMADAGKKYTTYTDYDMAQLLARVNDVTENPARPWIVTDRRNGRNQWVYYCNTDWYHELYNDQHPVTQHSVSISGGNKQVKYFLSGGYDQQTGVIKSRPDVFQKYNLRSKVDFAINKYIRMSNNTSFYNSVYDHPGFSDEENAFAYAARHALASFPLQNPDGSWVYGTPMISGSYNVANGRHIAYYEDKNVNLNRKSDFSNTTELVISPCKDFKLTANFTYRLYQSRNTYRQTQFSYRRYPDADLEYYTTGAGQDELTETVNTYVYKSGNVYGNYEHTWAEAHHLTLMAGMNFEMGNTKKVGATGQNLLSETLSDLDLVGQTSTGEVITSVSGGQTQYGLLGFFGRLNYDYKGRYLLEISGRYDGSSRFSPGHRWGVFPSASIGWRVSEEPFFANAKNVVDNFKIRASYGTLGNQEVGNFDYLQKISIANYSYTFGDGSALPKKSTLSAPVASDLTWETSHQYDVGFDLSFLRGKFDITADAYIRDTRNMLTQGKTLPAVYGASSPKMNAADLRTKGYELAVSWRDQFMLGGHPFGYGIKGTLSNFESYITKYDNPTKILSDYYEGMRLGDIWGFEVDGLFATDEEAKKYTSEVLDCGYINGRMTGGFLAGDLRFVDQATPVYDSEGNITGYEKDGILGIGKNTADDPGDRKIIGNSLPSLQYGFTLSADWLGFDLSAFFQGTGNHYWYPAGMNMNFWGTYSYSYVSFLQRDFIQRCWSEDNPDAYFPRPRSYSATGGELAKVNTRYLQNIRYLRLKNLTFGYTIPQKATRVAGIDKVRLYFSGENLFYWSPFKKNCEYVDPESAFTRDTGSASAYDHISYPWQKTFMFGIDVTF